MIKQKELVPKKRFQGFDSEWKKLKLEDATLKTGDGLHGTPKYKKDGKVFFINGNNLVNGRIIMNEETKRVSEEEQSKDDKTLCKDTILMSINGTIGNLAWYNDEKLMLGKSVAYMQIKNYNKRFIYTYLQTNEVYKYFIDSLTGSTIKNLGLKAIRETNLYVPSNKEQQKIGQFFKHLDDMIALEQRKIDKTKALKSAYLAEMFPAEGERVPKRRFAGFTGEWEYMKLKDLIVSEEKGRARAEMLGSESLYLDANYLNGGESIYVDSKTNVDKDDILILWDGSHAGKVYHGFKGALGSTLKALKPIESGSYIYYYLSHNQKKIFEQYRTPNIPHVINTFTDEFIVCKPNLEEQLKISNFFKNLDSIIATHEQKLEKLKATKQAYLHEMFV